MQSRQCDNLVFIHMTPGEDFYAGLTAACRRHVARSAVIVSSIGQFKQFQLGYFVTKGDYRPQSYEAPHELAAMSGLINRSGDGFDFHCHAVLGDRDKQTVCGHLIAATVEITNETVLMTADIGLGRTVNPVTGLKDLTIPV